MSELIVNIEKLHTTKLGIERIKRDLQLDAEDVVGWCKQQILSPACAVSRKGKNWYADINGVRITVNANSYTIITAHQNKGQI